MNGKNGQSGVVRRPVEAVPEQTSDLLKSKQNLAVKIVPEPLILRKIATSMNVQVIDIINIIFSCYNFIFLAKFNGFLPFTDSSIIVDCEWDEWKIGECSLTCGGGIQIKSRRFKIVAANGGNECEGSSNYTQDCNLQECPGT